MPPRKHIRPWKAAAAVTLGFALAVWATARPGDPALYPPAPERPAVEVFIVDNGFHPDIVLPRDWIARHGGVSALAAGSLPGGGWIEVGWGDERFYKQTGLGPRRLLDALRCLFWPNNRSVIRMEALPAPPDQVYAPRMFTRLRLSERGVDRMVDRLDRSFLSVRGAPMPSPPAPHDPGGVFFRSGERFSLLHMCNHWIADMLDAAGVPTTPAIDTVTAGLLLDLQVRARAAPHAAAPRIDLSHGRSS